MHTLLFTPGRVPFSYIATDPPPPPSTPPPHFHPHPPSGSRRVVISAVFHMVGQEKHLVLRGRSEVTRRVMDGGNRQNSKPLMNKRKS